MSRQSRPARDRRELSRATPAQVPVLAPVLFSADPATLTIVGSPITSPTVGIFTPVKLVLTGVPGVYRVAAGTYAATATLSPDATQLVLTFPGGDIGSGESFVFPGYDPAVRTAQGGFLAPGVVVTGDV